MTAPPPWFAPLLVAAMIVGVATLVLGAGLMAYRRRWRDTACLAALVLAELAYALWLLADRGRW